MSWTALLPLAGVVVGSGLTLIGQALTDKRALRRDEVAAQRTADQQRHTDWLIIQRQTVIELQESIELLATAKRQLQGDGASVPQSMVDALATAVSRLQARAARLDDRELADDVLRWVRDTATSDAEAPGTRSLLRRLGELLRRLHT